MGTVVVPPAAALVAHRPSAAALPLLALTIALLPAGGIVSAAVDPNELDVISQLYVATTSAGNVWTVSTGWEQGIAELNLGLTGVDPCVPTPWFGLGCSTAPDHVTYATNLMRSFLPA